MISQDSISGVYSIHVVATHFASIDSSSGYHLDSFQQRSEEVRIVVARLVLEA